LAPRPPSYFADREFDELSRRTCGPVETLSGTMKVIVVGGGIGGLSLALSLHQAGIAVRVYEAVRELAPLGVGINLQPAAVRELTELGLGDELARTGIATQALSCFNKFGQLIWSEPRGHAAGYKWPQYSIHRGQLQFVLLRALRERIGERNIRCGLPLVSFEQNSAGVAATFRDGKTGSIVQDNADVLVGADGIHSTVRQQLYPHEGEPRFARQILWRAAVDAAPFLGGRTMIIAGHFDQRIVVYPIGAGGKDGEVMTNWICQMGVADAAPPREDWNRRVSRERVLAAFERWRFAWLDMPALIRETPEIYEFPLVDRDPVQAWTFGRVTLIGDAAHPMHPSGSQAGSQAIIDARALTGALLQTPNAIDALSRYDAERRPVLNDITLRNRRLGPEAAMQLAEERAPDGFERIDDVVSPDEIKAVAASFSAAAGLDVEAVNGRPSYVPANGS
jgi:2-polyprenyl-6-methoxyphenol hydroxylase-like FAD-dependent oxidoreductase